MTLLWIRPRKACRSSLSDRCAPVALVCATGAHRSDRYYIERFLDGHRHLTRGRLPEAGDDQYRRQFGSRILSSNVLYVSGGNPRATVATDLTLSHTLPVNRFDCFVCTQTLIFIFDTRAAAGGMYQLLDPGGIVRSELPIII